jgi:GDP-L-fucose synthase
MRDFIHIEDCVDGILQMMPLIDKADAINLSTGIFTSFKEFAELAADVCGYRPQVVGLSDKPSGVFARAGDTNKQKKLGFNHKIDFRTGVRRAIEYYSRNMK